MKSTSAVLQGMRGREGPPPAVDVAVRLPLADMEGSAMVIIQCAEMTWGGTPVRCRERDLIVDRLMRIKLLYFGRSEIPYLLSQRNGRLLLSDNRRAIVSYS